MPSNNNMKIRSKAMWGAVGAGILPIRILLLVTYVAVAMALVFLFGGFNSNGPVQAPFIFMSWTFLIYGAFDYSGVPLFLLVFVLYLTVLLSLGTCLRIGSRFRIPMIPLLVHGAGIVVLFLSPGIDENQACFLINLVSWVVPVTITVSYFQLDCLLRERGRRLNR